MNEEVVYTFRAVDEISGPMKKAEAALRETADAIDSVQASGEEVVTQTVRVETALDSVGGKAADAASEAVRDAARITAAVEGVDASALDAVGSSVSGMEAAVRNAGETASRTADSILEDTARATAGVQGAKAGMDSARQSADSLNTASKGAETALEATTRASENARTSGQKAEAQMKATAGAADSATQAQMKATLQSVQTLTAMQSLQSGLSAITSSVQTLGIVDDATAETLKKVTAGIQLVVGTAQAVKGVVTLFQSLNAVLKSTAIISTFASIAENPLKGAAIVGAAGLAAGAVGGYMMSSLTQTKTTTINVSHESTARQVETLADAGAWY